MSIRSPFSWLSCSPSWPFIFPFSRSACHICRPFPLEYSSRMFAAVRRSWGRAGIISVWGEAQGEGGRERERGRGKEEWKCVSGHTSKHGGEVTARQGREREKKQGTTKRNMASCILIVANLRGCIRSKGRKKELRWWERTWELHKTQKAKQENQSREPPLAWTNT